MSVPTIRRGTARTLSFEDRSPARRRSRRSADHVGQEPEETRPLDGGRKLALLLGRYRGDAARHDLAALRDVALQELHVLVVDLGGVGARERTGLAAAKERTACCASSCHAHRSYSSVATASAGLSSRGGRPSRWRGRSPRSRSPRSRSNPPPRSPRSNPPRRSSRSRSRSTLRIIAEGSVSCSSTRMVRLRSTSSLMGG